MYLTCGKTELKFDSIKVLIYNGDGFTMSYKRLENGKFKCYGIIIKQKS
ncbi:IS66 family insertion sequence element accessory protein TnpB [Terrisporobacter mayombei]